MKHQYKAKNTIKESTDSQEDEKELRKDGRGSSDPKSQEETEEEEDIRETGVIKFGFQRVPKYRKFQMCSPSSQQLMDLMPPPPLTSLPSIRKPTPQSSSGVPPFVHSFQELSSQSNITKPGSANMEQGIKPPSQFSGLMSSLDARMLPDSSSFTSLMSHFESHVEREPLFASQPLILHHQGQPSFNYSPRFRSGDSVSSNELSKSDSDPKSQEETEEEEDIRETGFIKFGFRPMPKYRKFQMCSPSSQQLMGLMPPPPLTSLPSIRKPTPQSSAGVPPFVPFNYSPRFSSGDSVGSNELSKSDSDPKSQEETEEEEDIRETGFIKFGFRPMPKYRKFQMCSPSSQQLMGLMPPPPLTSLPSIRKPTPQSSAGVPPFVPFNYSPRFSSGDSVGSNELSKSDSDPKSQEETEEEEDIRETGFIKFGFRPIPKYRKFQMCSPSSQQLMGLMPPPPLTSLPSIRKPTPQSSAGVPPFVPFNYSPRFSSGDSVGSNELSKSDSDPKSQEETEEEEDIHETGFIKFGFRPMPKYRKFQLLYEALNVDEPLRKRSRHDHSVSEFLSTRSDKHVVVGQPVEQIPTCLDAVALSLYSDSCPPTLLGVSQYKMEQAELAETNEGLEPATDLFQEVKEFLHSPASEPETVHCGRRSHSDPLVPIPDSCPQSNIPPLSCSPECSDEERLEEETSGGFLWGAECNPDAAATYVSATNSLPPSSSLQVSSSSSSSSSCCCLTRSHSAPSLSKIPKNNLRRAASLPDMKLQEFTPAITDDFDDETYRFQCSCPGLYQCSVSGLVFNMKGEGDVLYRTVPWNRRLLAQHHKKPAGPLFDIKCLQQSVCQLQLPHCEIISTGGARSLQVAHVSDEGVEFIGPHRVTQTHVVLNISGFSAYGNVKDEDSPPDPVRALVLLFYKPPEGPDLRSVLSVLLLPRNVVIRDVQRTRRKLVGDERYIDTSPHCKLHPKQSYTLSTSPEDDLIKVQPKEAEFDDEYHESYFPSFQVVLKRILTDVNLTLRDGSSSSCVWEREFCLLPTRVKTLDNGPKKRASDLRSCFIRSISGPVLSSLLDHLLEKRVITDAEREEADTKPSRSDRARFVFVTVSNKGEAARSEMTEFLCEEDPFLCEHLGLKQSGEKAS